MSIGSNYDTNKSLEQLENNFWPDESKYPTGLIEKCHLFRKKPVNDLTVEELRLLIGQNIGLLYLIPVALNILIENPFANGDCYPGDLLQNVVRSDIDYWKMNKIQVGIVLQVIRKYANKLKPFIYKEYEDETGLFPNHEINDNIDKAISNFKINTSEIQSNL